MVHYGGVVFKSCRLLVSRSSYNNNVYYQDKDIKTRLPEGIASGVDYPQTSTTLRRRLQSDLDYPQT